jgi:hypothetical protein
MPVLRRAVELSDLGAPGRFGVDLDPEWTANGHCTAGYLAAVAAHAALEDSRGTFSALTAVDVRSARVLAPRRVSVEVEPVRIGTGRADWRVTVTADDQPFVVALVSTADRSVPDRGSAPPDLPAQDACVLLPTQAPGFDLPVMGVLAQYADPAGLTWLGGEPSGRGEAQGWVVPTEESAADALSLLAAPVPGALRLRRTVRATAGHLVSQTCDLWDVGSRHVATGHQLCTLRT